MKTIPMFGAAHHRQNCPTPLDSGCSQVGHILPLCQKNLSCSRVYANK